MANMQYSFSVNGYGLSGICTKTFAVTLPTSTFLGASDNAEVQLTCTSNSLYKFPKMYIASRAVSDGKITLNCTDRMIFTNQIISLADIVYYIPGNGGKIIEVHEGSYDGDGNITITMLLNHIAEQCGFGLWTATDSSAISAIGKLSKEQTFKRSCTEILDMIASACCGYWFCDDSTGTERLVFKAFGSGAYSSVSASQYTKVIEGSKKGPIEHLILVNGNETQESGSSSLRQRTIQANTSIDLANISLAGIVEDCMNGYVYTAWTCERALLEGIPTIDTAIVFDGGSTYTANYGTVTPTATGVYFSGGANEVSEEEYDYSGQLQRDMLNKVEFGNRYGGLQLDRDGKITVWVDKNKYREA